MAADVKRRPYDNSRRQARARTTRAEAVAAARQLFVERGYPGTTIEAIGEAAGVPLATLYRLFGSKPAILAAVLDVAFGGDDEPIAFKDRPAVLAAMAEPDPRHLLEAFARICRELLDRSAPIQHVLRSAASVDLEAAHQLVLISQQRLAGQSRIASTLAKRRALANGLDAAAAADIIYTLMSPEVHRILTIERGWNAGRYQAWLATALCGQLLEEGLVGA
jgi:AcrR family transcriptional regulator